MDTKQLQLVTFEQAKRLDAVGFDYPVFDWYFKDGTFHKQENVKGCKGWEGWHCWKATKGIRFSAPTVAHALKWMRDKKGLKSSICLCKWSSTRDGSVRIVYQPSIDGKLGFEYDTYEAAESVLLDELLTLLEEEKEQ